MSHPNTSSRSAELPALDENDLGFLGASLAPIDPPADVRDRILSRVLDRVRSDLASKHASAGVVRTIRAATATWADVGPGVQMRLLDDDGLIRTFLLRLAAGARLPAHDHHLEEACYVVEGDIWLSGVLMRAGDYQRVPAGATHSGIVSDGGCVLHIRGESSRGLSAAS